MGEYARAITEGRLALELASDSGPLARARALMALGLAHLWNGEAGVAEKHLGEAVESLLRHEGESEEYIKALAHWSAALAHVGRFEEAETRLRRALHLQVARGGEESPLVAKSWALLAGLAWRRGDFGAATVAYERVRRILLAVWPIDDGPDRKEIHLDYIVANTHLARLYGSRADPTQALSRARDAVESLESFTGDLDLTLTDSLLRCLEELVVHAPEAEELMERVRFWTNRRPDEAPQEPTTL